MSIVRAKSRIVLVAIVHIATVRIGPSFEVFANSEPDLHRPRHVLQRQIQRRGESRVYPHERPSPVARGRPRMRSRLLGALVRKHAMTRKEKTLKIAQIREYKLMLVPKHKDL